MDCQDVVALIEEIRHLGSELDDVEAKTAEGGLPERIYRSLSALSNRRGGGVILFGVDEEQRFAVVGVPDVARLQEEKILAYVRVHGSIRNAECRELLGLGDDTERARYILGKLVAAGELIQVGQKRGTRYVLPPDELSGIYPGNSG